MILSLVYLLSVGPVSLGMRLLGKDPLDRSLGAEPTLLAAPTSRIPSAPRPRPDTSSEDSA